MTSDRSGGNRPRKAIGIQTKWLKNFVRPTFAEHIKRKEAGSLRVVKADFQAKARKQLAGDCQNLSRTTIDLWLVLTQPEDFRNGIHRVNGEPCNLKNALGIEFHFQPVRLRHSAVIHVQDRRAYWFAMIIHRYEGFSMRTNTDHFDRIVGALRYLPRHAAEGLPKNVGRHFRPGWSWNLRCVGSAGFGKNPTIARKGDGLTAARSHVDGQQAHHSPVAVRRTAS